MAESLRELHLAHAGKVSQKWSLYLDVYDRALASRRERDLSVVEVGVQNGGSLEIWAKYFPNARTIVGCDIDERCGQLTFDDPRICVVVGPINSAASVQAILARANPIDAFIDDGSHASPDIVYAFCNYFPHLRPGGLYLIEDLHCAYRPEYLGGLRKPNAVAFFCALVDGIHAEYWKDQANGAELLQPFLPSGKAGIGTALAEQIASISFYDSLCIVEKRPADQWGRLGERMIGGREAEVRPEVLSLGSSGPV